MRELKDNSKKKIKEKLNKEKTKKKTSTKFTLSNDEEIIIPIKKPKDSEVYNQKKEEKIKPKSKKKKKSKNKKGKKNKKKLIIFLIILILLIIASASIYIYINNKNEANKEKKEKDISAHYNEYVITNKETDLYTFIDNDYIKSGKIAKNQELTLKNIEVTYKDEYLEITSFDDIYYIYYKDIDEIEELQPQSDRYKNYIVWNSNIVTKNTTNLYDEANNLVYTFNKSLTFPIIIKKEDIYGVEYNNKLLYVNADDIEKIFESKNTDKTNTSGIAVLNYHFFFNAEDPKDQCNQGICLSTQNLRKHLDYIKNNSIFTPSMKELEMYIDGYIQLPKSVVLTIDDGWRAGIGSKVISEYKMNATIFLMSKYYDPRNYQNEYIEVHSHGYDIHNPGICPGGQGGAIKCLEKSKLLEDLNASREKLNNTTYFCYPFYEYNDYSIEVLKEAGFTMAFGGYYEAGNLRAKPGINKYKIPRYVIMNYITANDIAKYIN